MERRHFITGSIATAGLGLTGNMALAAAPSLEGSVYYTTKKPGRWAKKAAGHSPIIETEKTASGLVAVIRTPHEMTAEHFIVKHVLMDENFNLLGEKVFDPAKDPAALSSYNVAKASKLYAISICNKHDTWLSEVSL